MMTSFGKTKETNEQNTNKYFNEIILYKAFTSSRLNII